MDWTLEELQSLAMQLRVVLDQEESYLSASQQEWAEDLLYYSEINNWAKWNPQAIGFISQVVSGKFKECY